MKNYLTILIFSVVGLFPFKGHAQVMTQVELEKQLEEAFEELDTEESGITGEQLAQFLEDLRANPININTAGINDLLQIPGMNVLTAHAILNYRRTKPFESIIEITKVNGIGNSTYQRMSPYITLGGASDRFKNYYFNPKYWLAGHKIEVLSRVQQNLEKQEGFIRSDTTGGYLGSPVKYSQRIRLQSNHVSMNITQEKDAGETLNGITGFDFNSWHVALEDNGNLNRVVIGDYSLSFGQGLVLWTGGAFGKGREVIKTISKNERGLRPYGSSQETDFFRGVAASYGKRFELTAFYSNRPRTASIIQGDTTRFPSSSGFHRTNNEYDRKHNMDQTTIGGRMKIETPFGLIGTTAYNVDFSNTIAKGSSLSNLYAFEGTSNSVIGVDYRGLIGKSIIFGEYARSENDGRGSVIGIESLIALKTEVAILYRNYQKDFQSFLGSGFGESSGDPNNERGFYIGLKHEFNRDISISAYIDQYKYPSPRSGTTQSTQGYDILSLIEARLTQNFSSYILIRSETKEDEYLIVNEQSREQLILGKEHRSSIRIQSEFQVNRTIRLRSRGEYVSYQSAGNDWESGFLIYQDLRLIINHKLQLDTRFTLFDTKSYNSRVYQFENDLLYVLSNVVLSDQGQRTYAVIKYQPVHYFQLWIKYSITTIEDAHSLSSGLTEIAGNRKSSLGIQARIYLR